MGASELHRLKPKLRKKRPATLLRALEQRFLFDAAAIIDPLALVDASAKDTTTTDQSTQTSTTPTTQTTAPTSDVSPPNATAVCTADTTELPASATTTDNTPTVATDSNQATQPDVAASAMFVPPSTISPELRNALQKATDTLRELPAREDFRQIIEQSFGRDIADAAAWEGAYQALQSTLRGEGLQLRVQLLSAEIMGVARAAFAAQGPDGTPVVYLNSDWLDAGASPDDITAALLEEAGHRLDVLMNDEKDSTGDEGEIFSEAVLGIVVSAEKLAQIQTENDHGCQIDNHQQCQHRGLKTGSYQRQGSEPNLGSSR